MPAIDVTDAVCTDAATAEELAFLRNAVGIEDVEDLLADLQRALS